MVALSVSLEGWFGLTWEHWKRFAAKIEPYGFTALFLSDHFLLQESTPQPSLELIVALTYLATQTNRIHFGSMVAPLSIRDPVMLARQAAALDDLSSGRMILGVGAGWNEPEHEMFGYQLGDIKTRMARFEEGLEVITRLLRSNEPVSYTGRYFQLHHARLLPRPQRPSGPPILIGGTGPQRTLPLVARYADSWNAIRLTPDEFRTRSSQLDQLLHAVGRPANAVKRTVTVAVFCGQTASEIEYQTRGLRRFREFTDMPLNEIRIQRAAIVGSPEEVVTQIRAYADAGADEVLVHWFTTDDTDGLKALAEQVLPHVTGKA
jgi:F420-dependent oxidoreductase-like protein